MNRGKLAVVAMLLVATPCPNVPEASTVAKKVVPLCAAVLAARSPTVTELPVPPSLTWLARLVVAPAPIAVAPA